MKYPDDDDYVKIQDLPLVKQGTSLAVVVPARVLRELGLGHGDFVRVLLKNKKRAEPEGLHGE